MPKELLIFLAFLIVFFSGLWYLFKTRSRDADEDETTYLARTGDPEAMNSMGLACFIDGDLQDAIGWYRKAADKGLASAQMNLCRVYAYGPESVRDYSGAEHWLEKALAQGDLEALYELGNRHFSWRAPGSDPKKAFDSWFAAAKKGHERAATMVGWAYRTGYGIDANLGRAAEWFEKAGQLGSPVAMIRLADMYRTGDGIKINGRRAFMLYAQAVASEWNPNDSQDDYLNAHYQLGKYHSEGLVAEQNDRKAAKHWRSAAERDCPQACYELGLSYREGRGVRRSRIRAEHWLRRAAELGVTETGGEPERSG